MVLLEEQQRELESIRRRQEKKGALLLKAGGDSGGSGMTGEGGAFGVSIGGGGPSAKDKRQAAQLMQSTETLMKFGFMSMSMTYFSSLNMIRAMRSVGASDTVMAALAHNNNVAEARGQASGGDAGEGVGAGGGGGSYGAALEQNEKMGAEPFRPTLKPGQLPGQEPLTVAAWSVDDVARWLQVHFGVLFANMDIARRFCRSLSVSVSLSVCQAVRLSVSVSVPLSIFLSVPLCLSPSVSLRCCVSAPCAFRCTETRREGARTVYFMRPAAEFGHLHIC